MRGSTVARFDAVESVENEWMQAHRALARLARQRASADAEEGRWLLSALRSAAHVHLGFGSFSEYIERLFGYSSRSTQEKLRVAEALEALPATARALEDGVLSWSAARELTRVAVVETEHEWLDLGQGKSIRQLEELVAGASPGDSPSAPRQPSARRHVLRFEVAPETFALFREALSQLRRRCDARLDDDSALLAMARSVLGGPRDEGRSSYQVSLNVCAECGGGAQLANGELVPVGPEIVALAQCDGQHLGRITSAANDSPEASGTPPSERAHVGAPAEAQQGVAPMRAKQTIPPALRRAILRRDQRRCGVPGCKNATFLDLHHIKPRSEGGRNEATNLITICGVHHRAVHRAELVIEGSAATGARFRHADGSVYGEVASPHAVAAHTKVFAALKNLGFRETEVRNVLVELRTQPDTQKASAEQLLREALSRLTPACAKR